MPGQRHSTTKPEPYKPTKKEWVVIGTQSLVVFAISLDMTILTATLPSVAAELHASPVATFWIAASYLLANAVVQPLMASLADIFGRRWVIFSAMCLFTLGSIVCTAATNVASMLAGRVIQGLGGGGILAVNLIIMSDIIPLRDRPKYISMQQLVISLGLNSAPIIGGAIIENTTWRWLFIINFFPCAVGLALIPVAIRYHQTTTTTQEKLGSVDWIGSTAFTLGLTAFLVGMTWGGTQFPWSSAATLIPIILGVALIITTGLYEKFLATSTFLRLTLFTSPSDLAIYFCTTIQGLTIFAQLYFLTLWLISIQSLSALRAGISLLAFTGVCIPSSALTGPLITRLGTYRWALTAGWILTTLSTGLLALLDLHTRTAVWVLIFLLAGIGQGIIFIAHGVAAQASCATSDAAHAMGMYSFARSFGLCLGVSLGATIWTNFLRIRFAESGLATDLALTGEGAILAVGKLEDGPVKDALVADLAWAFRRLFVTLCGISGLGLLAGIGLIKQYSLDREGEGERGGEEEDDSNDESTIPLREVAPEMSEESGREGYARHMV